MSKSEIPVDEVAGDRDPLLPEGVTTRRKGFVGKGLKGGTGKGAVKKGLRD